MTSLKRTSQGGGDESVAAASSPLHNPVQITKSAKKRLADPLSSVQRAPAPRRRPATKAPRPRRPIGLKPSELSRRASPGWAVLQFGARCEVRGRLLGRSCTTRCALAVQVAGEACFLLACVIKARWGRRAPFGPGSSRRAARLGRPRLSKRQLPRRGSMQGQTGPGERNRHERGHQWEIRGRRISSAMSLMPTGPICALGQQTTLAPHRHQSESDAAREGGPSRTAVV